MQLLISIGVSHSSMLIDDHYHMYFCCCESRSISLSICRYTQLEVDEHVAVCLSAMDWEDQDEGAADF